MVDAELAALALDPLLRRASVAVDLARIAGIGVHEHELADVVQQRGHHQPVARLVAELAGEPVGGALGGDRVQPEALGIPCQTAVRSKKSNVRARLAIACTVRGESTSTPGDRALDAARGAAVDLVGEPQHGDRQRDVGLDGRDDLGGRGSPASNRRSTRLRDSASIGNASSASNAAVSRRPWPSLWWRSRAA